MKLAGNKFGAESAKILAHGFLYNSSIEALSVSGKSRDGATKYWAQLLLNNPNLVTLQLVKHKVGDEGVRLLAAALSSNATLRTLDLRENKIGNDGAKTLAAALEFDTHLTELNLSKNKISDDGARALALGLRNNLWLAKLDISDNDISDSVIPALELTVENNLALNKYNGPISQRMRTLIENKTMSADNTVLNCSSMKLDVITSPGQTLTAIVVLNLFDNRLTDVPDWIPTLLPRITTLVVARNQITAPGLRPIVELASLTKLDVRVNRLETLPTEISRLQNLRFLDASFNQIGTLPPTLSQCTSLELLILYENQLEFIPSQMCQLTGLKTLDIRANTLKFVLDSALPKLRILNSKSHFEKLFQYLQFLGEGEPVKLSRCKLMLVGEANVGKSTFLRLNLPTCSVFDASNHSASLRKYLASGKAQSEDFNVTTDGIDIEEIQGKNVTFDCWDFAGQELYYTTHQFFLTDKAVYLIVFNLAQEEEVSLRTIEYWMKSIRLRAIYAPIVVVGTHLDKLSSPEAGERIKLRIKQQFKTLKVEEVFFLSCVKKKGRREKVAEARTAPPSPTPTPGQSFSNTTVPSPGKLTSSGGDHHVRRPSWDAAVPSERASIHIQTNAAATAGLRAKFAALRSTPSEKKLHLQTSPRNLSPTASPETSPPSSPRATIAVDDLSSSDSSSSKFPFSLESEESKKKKELKKMTLFISELARKRRLVGQTIPKSCADVVEYIVEFRTRAPVPFMEYDDFIKVLVGFNAKDTAYTMSLLNDMGYLLHFPNDVGLRSTVILNPQYLADIMSSVVTLRHNFVKDGRLFLADLHEVLVKTVQAAISHSQSSGAAPGGQAGSSAQSAADGTAAHQYVEKVVQLLEKFEVLYMLPHDERIPGQQPLCLVPCMLSQVEPAEFTQFKKTMIKPADTATIVFIRTYSFNFIPIGFFSRAMVRVLNLSGVKAHDKIICSGVWKTGFLLHSLSEHGMLDFDPALNELTLTIQCKTQQSTLLPRVVEAIDSLIEVFYAREFEGMVLAQKLPYQQSLWCCHCLGKRQFDNANKINRFSYEEVLESFLAGRTTIACNGVPVSLDELAPDILLSHLPIVPTLEVVKTLGEGGFGRVYLSNYNRMLVAVKELKLEEKTSKSENMQAFRRFHHEVYIMSKFQHPNLVRLYGISINPPRLVMEYVPHSTLGDISHDKLKYPVLSWRLRLQIAADVARGMLALHTSRPPVIHRDLRSQNIFIESIEESAAVNAKVGDFGLAQYVVPSPKQYLGGWLWLAPEVLKENGQYTVESDVYSFAIILWELASRTIPFAEFTDFVTRREEELTPAQLADKPTIESWIKLGFRIEGNKIIKEEYRKMEIVESIVKKHLRPTIPPPPLEPADIANFDPSASEVCPVGVRALIEQCWHPTPKERPSFADIVQTISHELGQLESYDWSKPPTLQRQSSAVSVRAGTSVSSGLNIAPDMTWVSSRTPSRRQAVQPIQLSWRKPFREPWVVSHVSGGSLENGRLWIGYKDGLIDVVDLSAKKVARIQPAHDKRVYAILDAGKHVWTCSEDHAIVVWDAKTFARVNTMRDHDSLIKALELVQVGRVTQIWSGDVNGRICVYDAETRIRDATIELPGPKQPACSIAVVKSRDPRFLPTTVWVGSFENIYVLDLNTHQVLHSWKAHSGLINSVASLRDEVWSCGEDGIRVWNKKTHEMVVELKSHTGRVLSLIKTLSATNETHIWSSSWDCSILVWSARTYQCLQELKVHEDAVRSLTVTMENQVASLSQDGTVAFWNYRPDWLPPVETGAPPWVET